MTSTISSNKKKNSFLSLLIHTFDKNSSIIAVYVCVLSLLMPIILWANQVVGRGKISNLEMFVNNFSHIIPITTVIFSIIIGMSVFSAYHDKRSTDLYSSLPASKLCLFLSSYVAGALIVTVPLILCTFISGLIGGELNYLGFVMTKMFTIIPSLLACYTMIAFLSMCCGTRIDTVASFIVINALYPILVAVVSFISKTMDPGYVETMTTFVTVGATALTPALSTFVLGLYAPQEVFEIIYKNPSRLGDYDFLRGISEYFSPIPSHIIYWCAFIVVLIIASVFIVKYRKNENVQNGFIFVLPKHIITVLAATCGGLFFGMVCGASSIDDGVSNEFGVYVMWAIIGATITYVIISLMYNRSTMKMIKSLPFLAISCVLSIAIYFSFAVDMFGNASYVPKASEVESVQITAPVGDLGLNYYDLEKSKELALVNDKNQIYKKDVTLTNKENIENVIAMHQEIIDNVHQYIGGLYSIECGVDNITDDYYDYFTDENGDFIIREFDITYYLHNGNVVAKKYYTKVFDDAKIGEYMSKVINSTEYKEKAFFLNELLANPNSSSMYITNPFYNEYEYYGEYEEDSDVDETVISYRDVRNTELFTGLAEALKKDFMADDLFETCKQCSRKGDNTYSVLEVYTNTKADYNEYAGDSGAVNSADYDDVWTYSVGIPVPKDRYENTWDYINSHPELSLDKAVRLQVLTKGTIFSENNPLNNN